jgi:type III secretory pathway component EscU
MACLALCFPLALEPLDILLYKQPHKIAATAIHFDGEDMPLPLVIADTIRSQAQEVRRFLRGDEIHSLLLE